MNKNKIFTIQPVPKLILASDGNIDILERIKLYIFACLQLAPFAFVINLAQWWIAENQQFAKFMIVILFINMVVGVVFHVRNRTFSFKSFFLQNALMIFSCSCVYVALETLRYTAGENIVGEIFKATIQSMTLCYPISKIAKNIFILTNGQFPAEWLMRKLYNFEKHGDLKKFFEAGTKEENDIEFKEHIKEILNKEKINEN